MASTTAIGDELRDYVIRLLEAAGHKITREPRVNTKKIDILLHLDDEFHPRTIAVECKNLSKKTSQSDLSAIYADHLSLIENKDINELWVIVRGDFTPEARNWADTRAQLHIATLAEFEERQEGFRTYARQVQSLFTENGLDAYYVAQHLTDDRAIADVVSDWIDSDDNRPLAILGGYGMGKTSFCQFLVSHLAAAYLNDPIRRVPVYIRLSDIAKEQDLDGLVAKTLAQRYAVKNYHFHKFQKQNSAGKFVIIFDGFDEMKHALSWSEFKYNFTQIDRVIDGRAKVIIAGRPNAFLSDDEHNWALRGLAVSGERTLRRPGVPEYIELEMRPFSDADARTFLRSYLTANIIRTARSAKLTASDKIWIKKRLEEFDSIKEKTELLRPVHLRIFAEIATDRNIALREFSVYELYTLATSRISEREAEKPQRTRVDSTARQSVIEDIAWWVWDETGGRSRSFNPARVPTSIIRKAFPNGADLTDEAMSREVFAGSFIERKHGDNFYFAHRSFLEFFVSKKLAAARANRIGLPSINATLNPEIIGFIKDSGRIGPFLDYVIELMQRYSGEIDAIFLREIADHAARRGPPVGGYQASVDLILSYLPFYDGIIEYSMTHLIEQFQSDVKSGEADKIDGALFFVVDLLRAHSTHSEAHLLAEALLAYLAVNVNWTYWTNRAGETATMPALTLSRRNLAEWALLRSTRLSAELNRAGQHTVILDIEGLYADLCEVRKPKIVVAGREPDKSLSRTGLRLPISMLTKSVNAREHSMILDLLRRGVQTRISV